MRSFSQIATVFILVALSGVCLAAPAPPTGRPQLLASFKAHRFDVWGLAFSPDGKILASAGGKSLIKLWDVKSQAKLLEIESHKQDINKGVLGKVRSVAFSPDGKTLASCGDDRKVKLWDVRTGGCKAELGFCRSKDVAFSPDGKTVLVNNQMWDVATGAEKLPLKKIEGRAEATTFPQSKPLVATATDCWPKPPLICLWDLETGEKRKTLEGHTKYAISLAFSPNGKILASLSHDNTIRLWDVTTGKNKATFDKLPRWQTGFLKFSPNGRVLALRYRKTKSTIRDSADLLLLNATNGKVLATLLGHQSVITSTAFSPDGRILASGDGKGMIFLWKLPALYSPEKSGPTETFTERKRE